MAKTKQTAQTVERKILRRPVTKTVRNNCPTSDEIKLIYINHCTGIKTTEIRSHRSLL